MEFALYGLSVLASMHVLHSAMLGHSSVRRATFLLSFSALLFFLSVLALLPVVLSSALACGSTEALVSETVVGGLARLSLFVSSAHTRWVTALCW